MLSSQNRLRKSKDIESVLKKGFKFKEGSLVLRVAGNKSAKTRFAFIVSGKVSKKAVIRNKIRRRLSEIIRLCMPNMAQGIDLIVIALPSSASREFSEIKSATEDLLIKAGLVKK